MIARSTNDPRTFQELVFPFLRRDPVLHSTILTNVADRVNGLMNDPVPPVCTPPAARGRGYASALTAHVTGRLSPAGDEVCLFTDLANPTSNKIYAAIRYRPIRDFVGYAFS